MDLNFLKGVNGEMDNLISLLQRHKDLKVEIDDLISVIQRHQERGNHKLKGSIQGKKQKRQLHKQRTVWDPNFFVSPEQQQLLEISKNLLLQNLRKITSYYSKQKSVQKSQTLDLRKLKKEVLLEIMKMLMIEYLNEKKFTFPEQVQSIDNIGHIVKNIKTNNITVKVIKEKIKILSQLMNIPILIDSNLKTKFGTKIQYKLNTPYYNKLIQRRIKTIFYGKKYDKKVNLKYNGQKSVDDKYETEYFLFSILAAINAMFEQFIPSHLKCLTFGNISQLIKGNKPELTFPDIINFISRNFPNIMFVIREIGFKKFSRNYYINQRDTWTDEPVIYIRKTTTRYKNSAEVVIDLPYKQDINILLYPSDPFCQNPEQQGSIQQTNQRIKMQQQDKLSRQRQKIQEYQRLGLEITPQL